MTIPDDPLADLPGPIPDEFRAAAEAGDPDAIFGVGRSFKDARQRPWVTRAAELGHPRAIRRRALIAAGKAAAYDESVAWLSRLPAALPAAQRITWFPNLFDRQGERGPEGWEVSPAFFVVSPDVDGACAALARAAPRLARVTHDGREAEPWEIDPYTPNWISPIYRLTTGAVLITDTKGDLPEPMGIRMLRAVLEEVFAAELSAVVVEPPRDFSPDRCEIWADEVGGDAAFPEWSQEGPRAWFMTRSCTRTTTDGRRYLDTEYLTETGEWVRDRRQGLRIDADRLASEALDRCAELRSGPRPANVGEPTWCRLLIDPPDAAGTMPPLELRADD